jgi:hypothetical protein
VKTNHTAISWVVIGKDSFTVSSLREAEMEAVRRKSYSVQRPHNAAT